MRQTAIAFLALGMCASLAQAAGDYDSYGGWLPLKGTKTSYFHTQQIDGQWWLVTPEGNVFFSKGVDNVSYHAAARIVTEGAGGSGAWARSASRQLREWNFNTAGAWSVTEICSTRGSSMRRSSTSPPRWSAMSGSKVAWWTISATNSSTPLRGWRKPIAHRTPDPGCSAISPITNCVGARIGGRERPARKLSQDARKLPQDFGRLRSSC